MAIVQGSSREITDEAWDKKEHDWTGKAFYFVTTTFLLGKPLGLDGKLEELNREVRQNGYKLKNLMILIQHGKFKGKVMIEVEKQDKYDAQIHHYDIQTSCDTILHLGGLATLSKGIERLKERVAARRSMNPREIYYLYQTDPSALKIILFAVS